MSTIWASSVSRLGGGQISDDSSTQSDTVKAVSSPQTQG